MPFTHIDIQKQRKQRTALLFLILVLYYFVSLAILWSFVHFFVHPFLHDRSAADEARLYVGKFANAVLGADQVGWRLLGLSAGELGAMVLLALLAAAVHWWWALRGGVERILTAVYAQPLDPLDHYHTQFRNIVDEARAAIGGRSVQAVVIPSLAVNAFAVATNDDNGVVGVTEGLLARLNRPQLEAVVAHETAHLFHRNTILVTLACSLFAVFAQLLRLSTTMVELERGRTGFLVWPLIPLLWCLAGGSKLLNMGISRQREYLADATAVQLTRNPTALAEALLKISSAWRGMGALDDSLAPIFILNPVDSSLDEDDSFWSNLFSTHPPINKRVEILTALARTDVSELERSLQTQQALDHGSQAQNIAPAPSDRTWWIQQDELWKGPYSAGQLLTQPTFRHDSWVCREGWPNVTRAADDPILLELIREKTGGRTVASRACPRCRQSLTLTTYEGAQLYRCQFCHGHLVAEHGLVKIIARREIGFSDRLKARVERCQKELRLFSLMRLTPAQRDASQRLHCPKCRHPMIRSFYSYGYRVVVDRCHVCQLTWCDHEELEMLQVMIEAGAVGPG